MKYCNCKHEVGQQIRSYPSSLPDGLAHPSTMDVMHSIGIDALWLQSTLLEMFENGVSLVQGTPKPGPGARYDPQQASVWPLDWTTGLLQASGPLD